jgi:hypothetical protein
VTPPPTRTLAHNNALPNLHAPNHPARQLAQAKASEIEALLRRLSDVNDEMGGVIGGGSDARAHTLARHRDVLLEYTQVGAVGVELWAWCVCV